MCISGMPNMIYLTAMSVLDVLESKADLLNNKNLPCRVPSDKIFHHLKTVNSNPFYIIKY